MGKSIFEQMGGTYTLGEDGMYYPDLKLPTDEEPRYGKYGRIRKTFLQKHRYGLYLEFLLNSQLVLNAVGLSGPLVLLTEPPVEYGVLLIFLTCHSYLLFVGAGRYGNTEYTAPALASLPEFYCS